MKITWVTLHVSDIAESVRFYNTILGLPIEREFGDEDHRIAFLGEPDSAKIELVCVKDLKIEDAGKWISVGFPVEELDEKIEHLRGVVKGEIAGPIAPNPGIRFYYVSDPDGYRVQLYENV